MADRAHTVVVLAKEPRPGRVKTRLQPAFTAAEAAELACAAIEDTLAAVRASGARRRVLAWDGSDPAPHPDFTAVPQPGGTLNARLTAAFADAMSSPRPGATLLIGMDTPQVSPAMLDRDWGGADCVLGLSDDGGFWAIGLRPGHPAGIFDGVPMSSDRTGAAQLARLLALGLTVTLLPPLRDVDRPEDADAVAYAHPGLRFSLAHAALLRKRLEQPIDRLFDRAYAGDGIVHIESGHAESGHAEGPALVLEVDRWSAAADEVDRLVVARCEGPVLDLGCGPGRMVRALSEAGVAALGVDISAEAVRRSLAGGGPALRRRVELPLPGEGRWGSVLLVDGNIGLGGDVARLLARCVELVAPGGLLLCEVDPRADRHEIHDLALRHDEATSAPTGVGPDRRGGAAPGRGRPGPAGRGGVDGRRPVFRGAAPARLSGRPGFLPRPARLASADAVDAPRRRAGARGWRAARAGGGRSRPPPARHLPARALLRDPLRLLRLQHLHRERAGHRFRHQSGRLRRRGRGRARPGPPGPRAGRARGRHGLRRRRHPDAAAGGRR